MQMEEDYAVQQELENLPSPPVAFLGEQSVSVAHIESFPDWDKDGHAIDGTEPVLDVGHYHRLIVETPAYSWHVSSLQREATSARPNPDTMEGIKEKVFSCLLLSHNLTREELSQGYQGTFELQWDPLGFVKEQEYTKSPAEALERAITITGSWNDAQALTTKQYLYQTWPATGQYVMKLVKEAISEANGHASCEYAHRCHIYLLTK